MAAPTRPAHLELRTESQASVSRPLRSPRLHIAGDVPPELSPLDAFALQSRLLAKQLEESAKTGRRVSRLPPLTTDSPLIVQGRSDYFRSLSTETSSECGDLPPFAAGGGMRPEMADSPDRPKSMHPRMSHIPPTPDTSIPLPIPNSFEQLRGRELAPLDEKSSYFAARRDQSPSSFDSVSIDARLVDDETPAAEQVLPETEVAVFSGHALSTPHKLGPKRSHESLHPPTSGFPQRTSSIMSQTADLSGDEAMGSSFHSSQGSRKMSTGSGSVFSPPQHQQRSPSISSNISELPRPAFNFSRPMSRAGTPGPLTPGLDTPRFDPPVRQPSSDSHSSFFPNEEGADTPISLKSEAFPDLGDEQTPGAPSYIYSKFSLPRGKMLARLSKEFGHVPASFKWEQPPVSESNVQTFPFGGQAPPSPPSRPSSFEHGQVEGQRRPSVKTSLEVPRPNTQPSPGNIRPSTSDGRLSEDAARDRSEKRPSTATTSDASTVKARSQHSVANTMATMSDMSSEEHVNKALALHEDGKVNESTYHLRYAAKQGHPTGMLFYALACRHGWGMRPNPEEAVKWLRKAADSAGLEIAEDENNAKEGQKVDKVETRTRKAQMALSIYELGVSHMNGWGIEQDKTLALRCFEIAGTWGDVDALAEAGFCYTQGIGCKKDLKKAARFYRLAEAKGMSMPGNSWIHKPKYDEDEDDSSSIKASKRPRSKSKSRHFLGLNKTRSNMTANSQ
ncbi:unnamed protein product [Discula destructiva]